MYEVYYRDRRTNQRAVHVETSLTWNGPFNYAEGNWNADCNRSREMYPGDEVKAVECTSMKPVLVVEKIVLDGAVVYHDEGISEGVDSDAADMSEARLFGAYSAVSTLSLGLMDTSVDATVAVLQARYAQRLLAQCPQHAHLCPVIEEAVAAFSSAKEPGWSCDYAAILDSLTERLHDALNGVE
jgi:hypothetical protein